jgi:DNA helicase HerA-like ATPase
MVEQMLRIKAQVIVLDGSGGWAGLRLGPKAFKIPVFGGLHGDIPLEPASGELVANLIVDRGISVVLDVSQMLDAERTRFATAFAKRFFQRKKAAPSAVHLVLEECQDFVPENCQRGEEQMLHEFQRLAKQGRPHGIGISFISQRPQEISKKALNQTECVFAFQMNGPHERKALKYWLSDKGFEGDLADVLPTLEVGAPYVWSPQWLKISKIVRILPIETLDTSATPKVGGKAFKQKKLTPIDLKGLTVVMADVVDRAKAEDPKWLAAELVE